MKVAYLAHDLTDAAVSKRVAMFLAGGAEVALAGFRRQNVAPKNVAGVCARDMGETFDGRLLHRAWLGVRHALAPSLIADVVRDADVVVARNLEMLLIADQARRRYAPRARLVYECLDIHASMTGAGPKARAMRLLEAELMRRVSLILVSSPAFISAYFDAHYSSLPPVILVENKVLDLDGRAKAQPAQPSAQVGPGPPWRIGWFGMLRSQAALDRLCEIARALPGHVEIVIRGRPTPADFVDFAGQVAATPGVVFGGSYGPDDLGGIYADIHFCWAIDLSAIGGNSKWLLPNRIYEGGLYGAVPIAIAGTETGHWLTEVGIGHCVTDPVSDTVKFISDMTLDRYSALRQAALALPIRRIVADRSDCVALVRSLAGAPPMNNGEARSQISI